MIIDAHAHIFGHACREVTPPEYPDGIFGAGRLLALMDREGVDKAVIVQNPAIGTVNDEARAAVEEHPDRFVAAIQCDPLDPASPAILRRYAKHPRQRILKLEMSEEWGWSGIHPGIRLNAEALRPLWDAVSELQLRVIIDPGAVGNPGYQVEEIRELSGRYPHVLFLLEHLGYLQKRDFHDAAARARRAQLLGLAKESNVYVGFSAVPSLLEEAYPCSGAAALLRQACDLVGAERILWGSDVPLTLRRYTYRQMIDVAGDNAALSERDRHRILGGNAGRIFFDLR